MMDKKSGRWLRGYGGRRRGKRHIALVFAVCFLGVVARPSTATEPQLPISFVDLEKPELIGVLVDRTEVGDIKALRQVHFKGKRIANIPIELEAVREEGRQELLARVPVLNESMQRLRPGAYAQKLIVEGRWRDAAESAPPLHVEQWTYFQVTEKGLRRLTLEEYSAIADPPEVATDPSGRKILVHVGDGRKLRVPIEETKRRFDRPLSRQGGIAPERVAPQKALEYDRSERDED